MKPRGRPRKHADYEALLASLPKEGNKRPRYVRGVGVFRGARGDTAWVKLFLRHGTVYQGKRYAPGASVEMKLGKLSSWSWDELEGKRDELQRRADQGQPLEDPHLPTFKEWSDEWLERAEDRLRSYEVIEIHVRRQLVPAFGSHSLDAITVGHIDKWSAKRLRTAAPATAKRELQTLSSIMGAAVRAGLLADNPCSRAEPIRGVVGRQRFLDGEELLRLLAAADTVSDWMADFILWSVHSGMRKGETRALTWADVRSFPDGRQIVQVKTSKTDQPRHVTCTRTMTEVLERQSMRSKPEGMDEPIFPVAAMTLRRHWLRTREAAGLEDVTIHDLRRTHSTHAAAAGVDLRTLADRIGHGSLTMLQRHYAAVVGTAASEAADTFQSTFDKLTETKSQEVK